MSPQRRIALVSVLAATVLIVLKLVTGLATGSLGLVSDALHSGTDLIAALLTFLAVGVAVRPADRHHAYGHGKAEHLAALAEAAILVLASLFIAFAALRNLVGESQSNVDPRWYAIAVVVFVIAVDASRMLVSLRGARRYRSAALAANAVHFGSDLLGSVAVLAGLVLARAGYEDADSAAALFVAVLVLAAAARLMRVNVDVLMDRTPLEAERAARRAIEGLRPPVELRRLRIRRAADRHFADVVIGVTAGAAVGQGHAAAEAVEAAVRGAVPGSDVVVHVEPGAGAAEVRELARDAAMAVPQVREVHNLSVVQVDDGLEVSLHLKLPGATSLAEAHAVGSEVEDAIAAAMPEVRRVQTHLEPLGETAIARPVPHESIERDSQTVRRAVQDLLGRPPRDLRFLRTDDGLIAYLTLSVGASTPLAEAHASAMQVKEHILRERPGIADVIVHTEP